MRDGVRPGPVLRRWLRSRCAPTYRTHARPCHQRSQSVPSTIACHSSDTTLKRYKLYINPSLPSLGMGTCHAPHSSDSDQPFMNGNCD